MARGQRHRRGWLPALAADLCRPAESRPEHEPTQAGSAGATNPHRIWRWGSARRRVPGRWRRAQHTGPDWLVQLSATTRNTTSRTRNAGAPGVAHAARACAWPGAEVGTVRATLPGPGRARTDAG